MSWLTDLERTLSEDQEGNLALAVVVLAAAAGQHVHVGADDRDAAPEAAAGEVEERADHLVHALGAARDPRRERQVGLLELLGLEHEFGGHHHGTEWRPQVVAENGEKHFLGVVEVLRVARDGFSQRLVDRFHVGRVLLAGGLGPENVRAAIDSVRPWCVDASRSLESSPGVKDHVRVRAFVEAVNG